MPGGQVDVGHQFQQAFVHAAQFFGTRIAVVHRGQAAAVVGPAQLLHGGEQVGVVEAGGVPTQRRALVCGKQAAEGGQGETLLALHQALEHDAQGLPVVVEAVADAALEAEVAQAGDDIAFGVGVAGGDGGGAIVPAGCRRPRSSTLNRKIRR